MSKKPSSWGKILELLSLKTALSPLSCSLSSFRVSLALQKCHTRWQYVGYGNIALLSNINLDFIGIKLRSLIRTPMWNDAVLQLNAYLPARSFEAVSPEEVIVLLWTNLNGIYCLIFPLSLRSFSLKILHFREYSIPRRQLYIKKNLHFTLVYYLTWAPALNTQYLVA